MLSCCLAALLLAGADVSAQTVEQRGYRPVDQTVDDVNPGQVSLREREGGLKTTGERNNVFRRASPDTAGPTVERKSDRLYYISPGVIAEFDRSEYAHHRRAGILQFIPPGAVFHLGMPNEAEAEQASTLPPPPELIDDRMTASRVGAEMMDDRLPRIESPTRDDQSSTYPRVEPGEQLMRGYLRRMAEQRASVLKALHRMVSNAAG